MAIIRWNPITRPSLVSRWMDDFFNEQMDRLLEPGDGGSLPAVNVLEQDDHFELQLAAPGMKKEDFQVKIDNGILSIQAEHKMEKEEEEETYTRREFSYRSFRRQFTLPENAKEEKIEAKYEDGILKLQIPKKEVEVKKKPKQIAIS
jgi:HSP20 family protein